MAPTVKPKSLIFDLDDTLFDTTSQLIEPAIEAACKAMIEKGLQCSLAQCRQAKREVALENLRVDFFSYVTKKYAPEKIQTIEQIMAVGKDHFYNRETSQITPFTNTHRILKALKEKYRLFLVTLGSPETQKQKIETLQLAPFFEEIFVADIRQKASKLDIFKHLLDSKRLNPTETLAIGNRIDDEIRFAKMLDMQTCLIEHGEYIHLKPRDHFEVSDFKIRNIEELLTVCRL